MATWVLVPAHARQALDLAAEQVDLFEVAACLGLLGDELDETRLKRSLDPLDRRRPVPFVSGFPAPDRRPRQILEVGDVSDRPAHPVEESGLAALVVLRGGGRKHWRGA